MKNNISKLFTLKYWHRKYYAWLKRRSSLIWAWPLSRERYFIETGRSLSYRHPDDVNQKLMWLNRYSHDFRRSLYADKLSVRQYVIECGYESALVPLMGNNDGYLSVNQIDIPSFPDKFVLKCNHGAGFNVICRDKSSLDVDETKRKLDKWMHTCYDFMLQEQHYRKIKPLIFCEKYLEQLNGGIIDYKFHCFRGKIHSCLVAYNRDPDNPLHSVCLDHYDIDWNLTNAIKPEFHRNRRLIKRPSRYEYMLRMSSVLSKDFDYVRVDLYEIDGRVYFGEMTFTPNACIMNYYEQFMLDELGKQLQLPDKL